MQFFCVVAVILGVGSAANFKKSINLMNSMDSATRVRRSADEACDGTVSAITDPAEKEEVTQIHNQFRSQENAANERELKWNQDLADRAQQWANACTWKHGMLSTCDGDTLGQNMYMSQATDRDLTSVVTGWASEKQFYNKPTAECEPDKVCGHYTQVVWAKTREVGCGFAQCPTVINAPGWNDVLMVVCNYSPAGNYKGVPIFEDGVTCSKCAQVVEHGWMCKNNLCHPCIPKESGPSCKCMTKTCLNGGTWSPGDCACICPTGFYGATCENTCACEDLYGDVCPTWAGYCGQDAYKDFMKSSCPKTCNMCGDLPPECE